jgi:D-alanyl-D-alanine dipeptidase
MPILRVARAPSRRWVHALLLGWACAAPGPAPPVTPEERGGYEAASDALAESLLVAVASGDSTIVVDARYAGRQNFTGDRLPGYLAPRALARREVVEALARVQVVEWAEATGRRHLLEEGYIARRSRHNLGVAVDLTTLPGAAGITSGLRSI